MELSKCLPFGDIMVTRFAAFAENLDFLPFCGVFFQLLTNIVTQIKIREKNTACTI